MQFKIHAGNSQFNHTGTVQSAIEATALRVYIPYDFKEYAAKRLETGNVAMGCYGFHDWRIERI